ncbi:zinc finger CCCH domain-containing protein 11A [Nilaparvata lugens]|uniref:zinc finger CCCH domain-containing protein 11A n=1 Tax=Nilaparvata lugens TaxID=108931 RepID=UPI00193E4A33|nr:zinc finger CCCH domain-containing protein 11A [Nilaparvata lugens]
MANKKLDDCYFYYYSTCFKGRECPFRHEELALGCETVCTNWKTGNCNNLRCQYRHMLLKKNRKVIPCFWESQPNGCRKPHCPFLHQGKTDGVSKDTPTVSAGMTTQSSGVSSVPKNIAVDTTSHHKHEGGLRRPNPSTLENDLSFSSPPVDPLVVKFEEESDNELDIPSPCKSVAQKKSWVKTLEEIRLEKIQKLSAAFYSFTEEIEAQNPSQAPADVMMDVLNKAIVKDLSVLTKSTNRTLVKSTAKRKSSEDGDSLGFRVLTLAEIREKRQKKNQLQEPDSTWESERVGEEKTSSDDVSNQESRVRSSSPGTSSVGSSAAVDAPKHVKERFRSSSPGTSRSSAVVDAPKHIRTSSPGTSSVVDAPDKQKQVDDIKQSSGTPESFIDVPGKIPKEIDDPPQEKSSQKAVFEESTSIDAPQQESSLIIHKASVKISPQKLYRCTEGESVDVPQQKAKEINVVSPLQQSTKVADIDACQKQKPVNVTSPLCQVVPSQNQQNIDAPSRSQQNVDVASRNQSIVPPSQNQQNVVAPQNQLATDVPPQNVDVSPQNQQNVEVSSKKRPIRLKRTMRRDTQEESDQGANSGKRSKISEDEQASFSLNSSRSEDAEQSYSNLSESTSNPGEMDTEDILNGIDELLGN